MPITVSDDQLVLLKTIGSLGFVNNNQLNLIWSVIKHYPCIFPKSLLKVWCSYDGLLKAIKPTKNKTYSSVIRITYKLSTSATKWLDKLGVLSLNNELFSVNSHNEQAIEVIVQGLYATCFRNKIMGDSIPLLYSDNTYVPLSFYYGYEIGLNGEEYQGESEGLDGEEYQGEDERLDGEECQGEDERFNGEECQGESEKFNGEEYQGESERLNGEKYQDKNEQCNSQNIKISDTKAGQNYPIEIKISIKPNSISKPATTDILKTYINNAIKDIKPKRYKQNNGIEIISLILRTVYAGLIDGNIKLVDIEKVLEDIDISIDSAKASLKPDNPVKSNIKKVTPINTNDIDILDSLVFANTNKEYKTEKHDMGNTIKQEKEQKISKYIEYAIYIDNRCIAKIQMLRQELMDKLNETDTATNYLTKISIIILCIIQNTKNEDQPINIKQQAMNIKDISKVAIGDPHFNIDEYDLRSFKRQFNIQFGEQNNLPFVADMMISFTRKNKRRQELYVELDNRTEGNATQIEKILNYIWYALKHPEKDISMILAITDGSLASRRVKEYTNIGRKLSNLVDYFLKAHIESPTKSPTNSKLYLSQLYRNTSNLHIYLTGVSEAHIDVAQALLGSNYIGNYMTTIDALVNNLNKHTVWDVSFEKSHNLKLLENNPHLLWSCEKDLENIPLTESRNKDLFRYIEHANNDYKSLGQLVFYYPGSNTIKKLQLLAAEEHELDFLIYQFNLLNNDNLNNNSGYYLGIFPLRIVAKNAISLTSITKSISYIDSFTPSCPYYIQPRLSRSNDLLLHEELRWLTIQYSHDIYNFFVNGAINKAAKKNNIKYSSAFIPLFSNFGLKRSFADLHVLATQLSETDFIQQLRLDEIPQDLYLQLLSRWPNATYSINSLLNLPYIKNPLLADELSSKKHFDFIDFIHPLNSTISFARSPILWTHQ